MPPSFELIITPSALRELNTFKAFVRRQIRDAIDQQLPFEPDKSARNRKMLAVEHADFEFAGRNLYFHAAKCNAHSFRTIPPQSYYNDEYPWRDIPCLHYP